MAREDKPVSWWQEQLRNAIEYRDYLGLEAKWNDAKDYYRNQFGRVPDDVLPYNLIYAIAHSMIPNVYMRNPHINVGLTPFAHQRQYANQRARLVEATDNWLIRELMLKRTVKSTCIDTFLFGKGINFIGYELEEAEPGSVEESLEREIQTATMPEGVRIEYDVTKQKNRPWVSRVEPQKFIVPWGVKSLQNCPWAARLIGRKLEDLKKDEIYHTRGLKGSHIPNYVYRKDYDFEQILRRMTELEDIVFFWEIRDFRTGKVMAIIPEQNKWLRTPEDDILQIEGLPFVDLQFNEDTELYWGVSDAMYLEPQLLEMNETRTQAMMHRRVALLKLAYDLNKLKDTEVEKLLSGKICALATDGNPNEALMQFQVHIPPDLIQWVEVIRGDVRELMGFSRVQMGEYERSTRRTATESQLVHLAHSVRILERQDAVVDMITDIIRKMNQYIFKFWTSDRVVKIVGLDGQLYWVRYNAEQIKGEYDYKIDVESMMPQTKALRKREIIEVLQLLPKYLM